MNANDIKDLKKVLTRDFDMYYHCLKPQTRSTYCSLKVTKWMDRVMKKGAKMAFKYELTLHANYMWYLKAFLHQLGHPPCYLEELVLVVCLSV